MLPWYLICSLGLLFSPSRCLPLCTNRAIRSRRSSNPIAGCTCEELLTAIASESTVANGGISGPTKPVSLQAHKKVLVTSPASGASGATGVQTSTYVVDIRCCKRSQCIALLAGGRRTSSSSPGQTTVSGLWELLQCALRSARSGPGCLRYIAPQRARQTSLLGRTLLQRGLRSNVCKRAIVSPHLQALQRVLVLVLPDCLRLCLLSSPKACSVLCAAAAR